MSLCTHPRSQHYADDSGHTRCACCGDVYEGEIHNGHWRPSRDSVDPPWIYTEPMPAVARELGLAGVRHGDFPDPPDERLPHDQRIVLSTFGLAVMAAGFEQTADMKEHPLMYRVAHLAADTTTRFSNAIRVIVETPPVQ